MCGYLHTGKFKIEMIYASVGGRQRPSECTEAAFLKPLKVLENESIF